METEVINMSEFIKDEQTNQWEYLCMHGKTMIMMYHATLDLRYLQRAQSDLDQAKSIKECGFVRPIGCYLAA